MSDCRPATTSELLLVAEFQLDALRAEHAALRQERDTLRAALERLSNPKRFGAEVRLIAQYALALRPAPEPVAASSAPAETPDEIAANGVNLTVVRHAYGWTYDVDGEVHGLVAGDHGFEPTGIKVADFLNYDALLAQDAALQAENKRLRDALKQIDAMPSFGLIESAEAFDKCQDAVRAALSGAQPDGRET